MSPVTAAQVSELRARTGVPMLQCKKALDEAQGNEEKAIEILKKSGEAQAVKKALRDQSEGAVFLAQEGQEAVLVILKCETDFVARNEEFVSLGQSFADRALKKGADELKSYAASLLPSLVQKLGENISLGDVYGISAPVLGTYVHTNRKIGVVIGLDRGTTDLAKDAAMHAAAMNPLYKTPEEVLSSAVEHEKEIWREQLKKEGKPEQIWDKIMMGKERKFREENALTTQPFVKDPSKTVGAHLAGATVLQYVRAALQ
ncbi:MAG: translation elongation factor Ts [Candidatus Peregrinibacteria bacterium]